MGLRARRVVALVLAAVGVGSRPAAGGEADVLAARVLCAGATCRVEATLRHADAGFEHYADRFEVLAPDGSLLGVRRLLHPHVEEQPFTRSLEGVRIPPGVAKVVVRAHDSVHGYGGRVVEVPVPARPSAGGGEDGRPARAAASFERTEKRAPCARSEPLRLPLFGDLHVHTLYSFDAYVSSQRNDPVAAYRFARGEPLVLPDEDGEPTVAVRLRRPLDFAAVTDHAEYLGPIELCTASPWRPAWWWPHCVMTRSSHFWTQLLAARWWTELTGMGEADQLERSGACWLGDCEAAEARVWRRIQEAAEAAYDRSEACQFTTFVAYEYTDAPGGRNLHRNVIFRNERVPDRPISTYDTGRNNTPRLWELLRESCLEAGTGCDVLAIPHNPNLAGGLMFRDPRSEREARDRLLFEPLVELTQHKGSSECRFDRLRGRGLFTEDELCTFEQVVADNLAMLGSVHGEVRTERAAPVPLERFARRNMVRNVLVDGLALGQATGINPFRLGFIGSTDTHNAIPGAAEEDSYPGHLGRRDAGYRNLQDHFFSNPGGLAVVWAEENSRDAVFEALRRRETYATSGTRPLVRFFGGAGLPEDLCSAPDPVARADRLGVPMGGVLRGGAAAAPPRFLVLAQKDPGVPGSPGSDLERAQIVKGWVDAAGATHERVVDVAGRAGGDGVDPATCRSPEPGAATLCAVWEDPDFHPAEPAFYYLRVLEKPVCRWSTLQCRARGVDPFDPDCPRQAEAATARARERGAEGDVFGKCCLREEGEPFYSPVIRERAWTSPIWYEPPPGPRLRPEAGASVLP